MRLCELDRRRVGILGFGREGRSALRAIRWLGLGPNLTVLDERPPAEPPEGAPLEVAPLAELALERFEVLIKAPGISPYRPEVRAAVAAGVRLTSCSALWFAEPRQAPVVAVSGTKGKSTTAALIHFLLRQAGVDAVLAGNVGLPLLDLLERPPCEAYVVELSSYQTHDFDGRPEVAVLTNLFPEHLDWHRDLETYYRDKLRLFAHQPRALVNGSDPESVNRTAALPRRTLFNHPGGWRVGQRAIHTADGERLPLSGWRLPGAHNRANLAAALAAVEALGAPVDPGIGQLAAFEPLPHRLEVVGEAGGIVVVDDSISTTPRATLAALRAFPQRPCVVIVGGFDRGLSWDEFAEYLIERPLPLVVATGANRSRIAAAMAAACPQQALIQAETLAEAVPPALAATPPGGVLLLSPGAPSFGEFENFEQRGRRFRELALGSLKE